MNKFPPVSQYISTGDGHELAIYECGNPQGIPVVVCHGGPGGRITHKTLRFLDLYTYRVIAFDQRGCGASKPFASIENNTINHLVSDIELIRNHFNLEAFYLFGGSFGTTLALSYAIAHPQNVLGLILRGVFLGRPKDIRWLYQEGASYFYPENFDRYKNLLDTAYHSNIIDGYEQIFSSDDHQAISTASMHWAQWEMGLVSLKPSPVNFDVQPSPEDISLARLECYYFSHNLGWDEQETNYILDHIDVIKHIKTIIIHGRYDIDCIPGAAYDLYKSLDNCDIYFPLAGHGANDTDLSEAILEAIFNCTHCERIVTHHLSHEEFSAHIQSTQDNQTLQKPFELQVYINNSTFERKRIYKSLL